MCCLKYLRKENCLDNNDLAFLILRSYDGYLTEVFCHMEYKNKMVFTYVEVLCRVG